MLPTLLGYFPKRTSQAPDFLDRSGANEVASVAECISPGPTDWFHLWIHNGWGFFATPAQAEELVDPERAPSFDIYAYELYPMRYARGVSDPCPIADVGAMPLDESFEPLGFDIVSKSDGVAQFECSPLSCNGLANEEPVNRHCLVDELEVALALAGSCEERGCEPGPYFVLRVWRRRKPS